MLRFTALFMLTALLFAGSAQAQNLPFHFDPSARDEAPDLSAVPTIRFLTTNDFPPFNYRSSGGEVVGFNVDLARAICDILDIACTLQAWPWDQAADALADNQGDALIAGMSITAENAERFDFSLTYMMLPGRFVTRKADIASFNTQNLAGRIVATRRGSAQSDFIKTYVPGARVASYENEIAALEAVAAGDADAYFGDAMRASFWLNENPQCCNFAGDAYFRSDLFGSGLAVAFPADHNAVHRAVNWALVRLKRNGALDELYLRWFPVSFY